MKKLFDARTFIANSSTGRCKVRVIVLTGGGKQKLARKLSRQKNTIVLVFDNHEEIERIKPGLTAFGVMVFSLGTFESLATLCEDADPRIREAAREVATMLAREGCGASPLAGQLAALKFVHTREFQHAMQTILDRALRMSNGRLPSFEFVFLGSYVGGVGAGSVSVIAESMMQYMSTLPVTVKVVLDLTGAITFSGVSPLARQNAAATLPHLVHFALKAARPEFKRMTVHVYLSELLPVGQDHKTRDLLTAIDEQSIRSTELQEILIRLSPNLATAGLLGNVITRELEVLDLIDIDAEVLPTVASRFLTMLREGREQVMADPSQVREMRWSPERKVLNRSEISEIVDHANTLSFNEFWRAVMRVGEAVSYACLLDLGADGELDLTKVDEYFAEPPASASVAMQRLSLLETLSAVAEQEAMYQQQEIDKYKEAISMRVSTVRKLFESYQSPRFWQGTDRLARKLTEAAQELRSIHDRKLELEAQLALIQLGRTKVNIEREFLINCTFRQLANPPTSQSAELRRLFGANSNCCFSPRKQRRRAKSFENHGPQDSVNQQVTF